MEKDFFDAGVEMHRVESLGSKLQTNFNATARHTMIVKHQGESILEVEPHSEWASELRTALDKFEPRYATYWSHIGATAVSGHEAWMKQLATNTEVLRETVGHILHHIPPTVEATATDNQSIQPPVTPPISNQSLALSLPVNSRLAQPHGTADSGMYPTLWDARCSD